VSCIGEPLQISWCSKFSRRTGRRRLEGRREKETRTTAMTRTKTKKEKGEEVPFPTVNSNVKDTQDHDQGE
jgi:hypothetical protein